MRSWSVLVALLVGCSPSSDGPGGPSPAAVPSVFPPPDQLVDDRQVTSDEPDVVSGPDTTAAPDSATPPPLGPSALAVRLDAGTLMYPSTMWPGAPIPVNTDQPITAAALSASIELLGAASKEDLVAWRTKPVTFSIESASSGPDDAGRAWLVRPTQPFRTGHWYRVRVAASLQAASSLPVGHELVSYLRGPEPLQVTSFSCGWPVCTTDDRWTVSFNGELDQASLPGCIRTTPPLDLGPIAVEGWSIAFKPTHAKVGTDYKVSVSDRCKNTIGDRLASAYDAHVKVERPRARLSLPQGTGYIAPSKSGTLPTIVVGAAHTGRLTVGTTRLTRATLPAFLAGNLESWGGFSFTKAIVEHSSSIVPVGADDGDVAVPIPLAGALAGNRGVIYLRVEAERVADDDQPPFRQALVQVTELGLSVKTGPEETLVWVTSLVDQKPLAGVEIMALDGDGKAVWTQSSDERGIVVGPGRKPDSEDAGQARIVMAARGKDLAFLDLSEYMNRSEPYEFGLPHAWDANANALRGIVFTERGVYRTGETVHVKGYVRVERAGKLEKVDAPMITVTVTNALGEEALESDVALGTVGDFTLDVPLGDSASLGSWRIAAALPEPAKPDAPAPVGTATPSTRTPTPAIASGAVSGSFRVEAYRPNTFEVKVSEVVRVTGATDHLNAKANGRYYYGAPMVEATARWWVNREDADFSPKGYENYSFEVPAWSDDGWEPEATSVSTIANGEATLDADGNLALDADLAPLTAALTHGPQGLQIEVEVSDVDQQVVTGRGSLRVESADHYLGLRASTTFAGIGEGIAVDAVALTPEGQPVADKPFELRWIQRTWDSHRVTAAGGGVTWVSEVHELVLERQTLKSALTPVRASFAPKSSGLYWVEAEGRDAKGRMMRAREAVWVWGDGARWAEGDEGHVELIAAQETWKVGDTARYVLKSPFPTAEALITVEASGIVWRDTRTLKGTAPLLEIPVTAAMQPNAYVSVVLLGVPKSAATTNATKGKPAEGEVRLGYAKMQVDTADRRLAVTLTPDQPKHAPGESMRVKIELTDPSGKPTAGRVTFMAVDEGVLSLTGYQTPDPLKSFYAERSLAIITSESRKQMWSRLVDEDGMKSDWGGGGEGGEATNYRAAFATTAAFLPDVAVGSGGTEVSFDLPDNLTTFRLMAVAASEDGRYGQGQSKVEVRKPLMVRPGLPRFLSVGDHFDARAVVQAMNPELAGAVDVSLSVSGPIALDGVDHQKISAGLKATPVTFGARATQPGIATFAFSVSSGPNGAAAKDAVQVQIPVIWPAAKRTAAASGVVVPSETRTTTTIEIPDWVRDDIGGIDVTLTATRLGELLPGLDYLLHYPYGCVEQTTGGTLPLLALNELQSGFELPGMTREQVLVRAQAGVDRLQTMQTWSGGLAYWPGDTAPHPWGSVYGGMALVRASKMPGLNVPAASLERLTNYLRDILRDQAATAREEWHSEIEVVKPFAAYVLALAGTPEPAFTAALFDKRASLPDFSKLLLALAVDASHGDVAMANQLIDDVLAKARDDGDRLTLERDVAHYYYSTMDSDVRSMALLALALQAVRPEDPRLPKVQKALLEARHGGQWISTQDNAFAILALARTFVASENPDARFTAKVEVDGQTWLEEAMRGDQTGSKTLHLPMYLAKKASGKKLVITRDGDDAPVYFSLAFEYAPKEVPKQAIARGFDIERRYRIANGPRAGQSADKLQAGDIVRVDITVDAFDTRRYVAVDDPLPAGLEPITLDFATTRASLGALAEDPKDHNWWDDVFNHKEQRDDRVVLFSDVMPRGKHTYTYLARATTAGSFLAPAARVHEMYHPDVYGQSRASGIVVQ